LRNRADRRQDHRHDVWCVGCLSAAGGRIAAMLAPYLSGQLSRQSDFGHPAGAVVGDNDRFWLPLFRTSSKIWLVARIAASAAVRRLWARVFAGIGT